jgi:hypothetical protein
VEGVILRHGANLANQGTDVAPVAIVDATTEQEACERALADYVIDLYHNQRVSAERWDRYLLSDQTYTNGEGGRPICLECLAETVTSRPNWRDGYRRIRRRTQCWSCLEAAIQCVGDTHLKDDEVLVQAEPDEEWHEWPSGPASKEEWDREERWRDKGISEEEWLEEQRWRDREAMRNHQ